jgi:hypothetical protein
MHRPVLNLTCTVLSAALVGACAKREKAPEQAQSAAPPTVHVVATDYAFQAPDTLPAGLTAFHLMNNGKELHHLVLIRLAAGQTPADLAKLDPAQPLPEGMVMVGGPNPANPGGGTAESIVELKPGNYVMACFIPASTDGKPHIMHGMVRPLTVTASQVESQAPTPDVTLKLSDYAFESTPALTGGHHVIRVENDGPQLHELVLVKLDAGKTVQDFLQWAEKLQGPPPGTPVPGVSLISKGEINFITLDLVPGEYGMFCFVQDSKDGKPHFMHGMVKQVTVM